MNMEGSAKPPNHQVLNMVTGMHAPRIVEQSQESLCQTLKQGDQNPVGNHERRKKKY
jgi:hypothetical protein